MQTIPEIDEKTAVQQIKLMEALWKSRSERKHSAEPSEWHRDYLAKREKALANGEDWFIGLDELEADLCADRLLYNHRREKRSC